MFGLVDADFAAAGQGQRGEASPSLFGDSRHRYIFLFQIAQGGGEVVAHEVEFVLAVALRVMKGGLGGRQREDEPSVAGVDRGKSQHIAEEGAVGFGIFGVQNDVGTVDHGGLRMSHRLTGRGTGQARRV